MTGDDDDDGPSVEPPMPARCPWCGRATVRELALIAPRTTRYFTCDHCRRRFAVDLLILPKDS